MRLDTPNGVKGTNLALTSKLLFTRTMNIFLGYGVNQSFPPIPGAQLESEKMARVNAEEKAETLARQRAVETERMKELENIRSQLEVLLEEERQAKKDEEIVRTLQVCKSL